MSVFPYFVSRCPKKSEITLIKHRELKYIVMFCKVAEISQNPLVATPCGFDPRHRHHENRFLLLRACFFVCALILLCLGFITKSIGNDLSRGNSRLIIEVTVSVDYRIAVAVGDFSRVSAIGNMLRMEAQEAVFAAMVYDLEYRGQIDNRGGETHMNLVPSVIIKAA